MELALWVMNKLVSKFAVGIYRSKFYGWKIIGIFYRFTGWQNKLDI